MGAFDPSRTLSRLHLLKISRANNHASRVREDLTHEGISTMSLRTGKWVLYVGTGFSGKAPECRSDIR